MESIGLTAAEVEARVRLNQVNGDPTVKTKTVAQIFRANLFTFFNILFVALAVLLSFFVRDGAAGYGNFGFLGVVVFNAAVGTIQELKAKRTVDKLSLISAPKARVVRGGEEVEIAVRDIVLDDVCVLSTGSQICADAVILEGKIEVNESLVTGEPDAIEKTDGSEVLSGSFVVAGRAYARVAKVGADNFAAKISAGAKYYKKPESEIQKSLALIVKFMTLVIVPLGVALFCVKYFAHGGELDDTAITTVGTMIGMIPSGLVALSSTVFCVGVVRLAAHKTLAQNLYCVETLARVDVICFDKTGTLTEGSMDVEGLLPVGGARETDIKQTLKNFIAATGDANATAQAIKAFVAGIECGLESEQTVPFSSSRRWSGARFGTRSYVLGAPELFSLTQEESACAAERTACGCRVLAIGYADEAFDGAELPENLQLESLIFITDKIRPEAPDTLKFFREENVAVKIISGDNPVTVRAVALRAGLADCEEIVDMSTVHTDEELDAAAERYTVFGRVSPEQKLKLVKALKAHGHTVAMTGDGVNDVLALKEADCSIAPAAGSDAAKNVSSLILLDNNFASMPRVVAEGRRSINNLERSAALFLMKTIYNALLAILFLCVAENLPFEPRQLTLIGALTIGIPAFILALEPNRERVTGKFLPKVLKNATPGGLTAFLGVAGVVICIRSFLTDLAAQQNQMLYVIVAAFVGFVFLAKVMRTFTPVHIALFLASAGIFAAMFLLKMPFLQEYFGIFPEVTRAMGGALAALCATLIPVFVLLCFAAEKLPVAQLLEKIGKMSRSK